LEGIAESIGEILNNPSKMEEIKNIAKSLGLNTEENDPAGNNSIPDDNLLASLTAMMKKGDDDETRLLLALRPFLSEERQKKLDESIKILKIIKLFPLLSKSGIFKLF
jgi:hypothetical protein